MRSVLLVGVLLVACSDEASTDAGSDAADSDTGVVDGGVIDSGLVADSGVIEEDGGVIEDAGGFADADTRDAMAVLDGSEGCPSASSYVGDNTWPATLTAGPNSRFCAYPAQNEPALGAINDKLTLRIVEGSYNIPLVANGAALFIPACFESIDDPPAIGTGTVEADRGADFEDPTERHRIRARFPLSDGRELLMSLRLDLNQTDLSLVVPVPEYVTAQAQRCETRDCISQSDKLMLPCNMRPRLCDRFVFEDGWIAIEQFHWAGSVGAGFASPLRLRGEFRNEAFDITNYEQMTMGYGHHAFTRELVMFFDAPIDGVCGLHFPEVSEYGTPSDVILIDCVATPIGMSNVTNEEHLYNGGCPP